MDDAFARQVELALEFVTGVARFGRATQDHLSHPRADGGGACAQRALDHGHRAEGEDLNVEIGHDFADDAAGVGAVFFVLAEEEELTHG